MIRGPENHAASPLRCCLALLLGFVWLTGCGKRNSAAPVVEKAGNATSVTKSAAVKSDTPPPAASIAEPKIATKRPQTETIDDPTESPVESPTQPAATPTPTADKSANQPDKPPNPQPDLDATPLRMLLPTMLGPLIIDLDARIDDQPLSLAFEQRMKQVMSDADADESSSVSWDELFDHVSADPQQFGNNTAINRGMRANMVKRYDRNRNQQADEDEVALFLFRDAGFSGPFRLWGTDYFRRRQGESNIFQALDRDNDGKIQATEIDVADESLLRADQNTDQRIDVAEVLSVPMNNQDPAWNRRRSSRHGDVATDLIGYIDWAMVSYSIAQLKGSRPFSLTTNPINQIDRHDDSVFNTDEVKALLEVEPDLILRAKLSSHIGGDTTLEVLWAKAELQPAIEEQKQRHQVSLADGKLRLTTILSDKRSSNNQIPIAVFEMLDADNDGGLDENEIPAQFADQYPLDDYDADDDGKLTLQEINEAAQIKAPIWSVQLRGRGAEFPEGSFALLDQDRDWTLSTREIAAAPLRLRQIAAVDGSIQATDIPSTFLIQLVRGNPGNGIAQLSQLFAFSGNTNMPSNNAPQWAQRMDANQDGEISKLEFPGSPVQFAELDGNGDGFIEFAELQESNTD